MSASRRATVLLRRFGTFWYDFIVGDDWRIAFGVVCALALTYGVHRAGVPAWWVLPAAVVLLLGDSLWRAAKPKSLDR